MDPAAHDPTHDRVRTELARLGADTESAAQVPPGVTERIDAALRSAGPAHTVERPRLGRGQRAGLIAGLAAVVAGAAVGAATLMRGEQPARPVGPTAKQMTARPTVPLSDAEILDLLSRQPDYGALSDPQSCVDGLGFSGRRIWGARPVDIAGTPAVLLVLPGDTAGAVVAVAVPTYCSAARTGRLAETRVSRP